MIIFITGATSGFGAAMARRFIKNGHKVIATGRRQERLLELRDELGENLLPVTLDIRDKDQVEKVISHLSED
ncbi:MAG: SDR family NAD(P)-dependent oxidoreductase [Bacteriovoracaceae bacterium]|nr:SDR family NAD(P)-dependent oxidoreductase [Bacteriovoracaceae bacterium]